MTTGDIVSILINLIILTVNSISAWAGLKQIEKIEKEAKGKAKKPKRKQKRKAKKRKR